MYITGADDVEQKRDFLCLSIDIPNYLVLY
jgi:hypothetical protein